MSDGCGGAMRSQNQTHYEDLAGVQGVVDMLDIGWRRGPRSVCRTRRAQRTRRRYGRAFDILALGDDDEHKIHNNNNNNNRYQVVGALHVYILLFHVKSFFLL